MKRLPPVITIALVGNPLVACTLIAGVETIPVDDSGSLMAARDSGSLDVANGSPDVEILIIPPRDASTDRTADGAPPLPESGVKDSGSRPAMFEMTQTCISGNNYGANLSISTNGLDISVVRSNPNGNYPLTYGGAFQEGCLIASGTYTDGSWSATVYGSSSTNGGCSVGSTWAEQEADCVAGWSLSSEAVPLGASATFHMLQICDSGPSSAYLANATMHVSLSDLRVTVERSGTTDNGTLVYSGTMDPNCTSASGTYGDGGTWAVSLIVGGGPTASGCSLGEVWQESEPDCVAVWVRD